MATFNLYNRSSGTTSNFPKAAQELKVEIEFIDESVPEALGIGGMTDGSLGKVVGYLSKKFEYDATGNYSNIFNVQSFSDSIGWNFLKDETQRNFANYGYLTKKVYNQGFSPTLTIDFRCYAGDDDHTAYYKSSISDPMKNPIAIANALVNATLPRVGKNALFNFTSVVDKTAIKKGLKTLGAVGELAYNGYKELGMVATGNTNLDENQKLQAQTTKVDSETRNLINNLTSRKPPTCNVKVGNIFQKDMMVVKQVHVELSMEYLAAGVPLYGDFSVTLESLFNAAVLETGSKDSDDRLFGSGLNFNTDSTKNRVSFDVGNKDVPSPINDPTSKNFVHNGIKR